LFRTNAIDDRVRKTLVETLYTQPANLAVGAGTGILASLITASLVGIPLISHLAWALTAVAVIRVTLALILPRFANRDTQRLELIYELGAFTYSGLLGLIAALTVWYGTHASPQLLIVAYAIGYGAGIAARNAGRPMISIVQMLLVFTPINLALWNEGGLAERVLVVAIVLLWLGMMSITMHVFRTLRDSVAAAETSARLAEKMQTLARTDVVTGLNNRAGLNHYLVEHLSRQRTAPKLALFWLDLDKFKDINDALGHQVSPATSLCSPATSRTAARSRPSRSPCSVRSPGRCGSATIGSRSAARWVSRCCPTTAATSKRCSSAPTLRSTTPRSTGGTRSASTTPR
jgi:hypothetical protein